MSLVSAAPVAQEERISIIDSIRGFALLGILLMNIPFFSDAYQVYFNLDLRNEYSGPNYYTWWAVNGLFEGTMRALFSILFGAGSLLLLKRLEKKKMEITPADFYYRRMIWLLVFGVFNAFLLLWPGDILYTYAICGLFLYPLRNLKPKHLFLLALLLMLIANLRATLSMYDSKSTRIKGERALALEKNKKTLTEDQQEDKKKWEGYLEKHKKEAVMKEVEKERAAYSKGYFSLMGHLKEINVKIQSVMFYDELFWDALSFLILGMALFKLGILTGERSISFYWILLIVGYGLGLTMSYFNLSSALQVKFDYTRIADKVIVNIYQERRLLLALGHLSVLMLLYKYKILKFLLRWLANVGQMAFSNYLMQSIICGIIFYGYGFGLYGKLERYEQYFVVLGVWIFQIIFSQVWLKYFRYGPFEWVWRSLTYWKLQPFRKPTAGGLRSEV